jgi:hypothetical protein
MAGTGGAIYATQSNLIVEDCTFDSNVATTGSGGAITFYGHSAHQKKASPVTVHIERSSFLRNTAEMNGGALAFYGFDTEATLKGNTFDSNRADDYGDAIYREPGRTKVNEICSNTFAKMMDCRGVASQSNVCEGPECWPDVGPDIIPDPSEKLACLSLHKDPTIEFIQSVIDSHFEPIITLCPFTIGFGKKDCETNSGIVITKNTTLICGNGDNTEEFCSISCVARHFTIQSGASLILKGTLDNWLLSDAHDSSVSVVDGSSFRAENVTWNE